MFLYASIIIKYQEHFENQRKLSQSVFKENQEHSQNN